MRLPLAAVDGRSTASAQAALPRPGWSCGGRVVQSNALAALPGGRRGAPSCPAPFVSGPGASIARQRTVAFAVASPADARVEEIQLTLSNGTPLKVTIEQLSNGGQAIRMATSLQAGRLLLHWGVEGGPNYKGGWRLPASSCWPPGTVQYKDRAVQSPWKGSPGGLLEISVDLPASEASDVLNFVLKDDATNTWWDCNGSNFTVPLRPGASPQLRPETLPKALCDKWAWTMWDANGRPSRSEADAAREYDDGVEEMKFALSKGRTIDELWRVAEGKWKYNEYRAKWLTDLPRRASTSNGNGNGNGATAVKPAPAAGAAAPAAPPKVVETRRIPDELLGVQAYVCWEHAGKPNGADFAGEARRIIEEHVRNGLTYEQVAALLKYTPKMDWGPPPAQQQQQQPQQQQPKQQAPPPPPPQAVKQQEKPKAKDAGPVPAAPAPPAPKAAPAPAPPPPQPVQVGQSLGNLPKRNPLDLVKKSNDAKAAPSLSEGARPRPEMPLDFLVQNFAVDPTTKWRRLFPLGGAGKSELLAVVRQESPTSDVRVDIITDSAEEVVLHWGLIMTGSRSWHCPPEDIWPEGGHTSGYSAVENTFKHCDDDECDVEVMGAKVPLQRLVVTIPRSMADVSALTFVLRSSDSTMWYKDAGYKDFRIPIPSASAAVPLACGIDSPVADELSQAIIDAEDTNAWTLMHRFNRAAELINDVLNGNYSKIAVVDAMARIYIWLRYSSTRHLTWQRNYNTQPRILSAAQDRLTNTVASAHSRTTGEAQEWVRLMLSTVGRGGDGQKIRDEILNIMHRNRIPEKKGLWMEEWHQKLHNNTTPDDVPICEAYLAFLESNGNVGAYWRVLSDAGISRERLESFERPVKQEPEWDLVRDKRDPLIRDFRNYLGILKAVHSGADLQASAAAAGNRIPGSARGFVGYVMSHLGHGQVIPLMEAAVEARTEIASSTSGNRELLYLDLALEDQVRQAAERGIGPAGFGAAAMMKPLLQNLCLSLGNNEELCYCLKAWQELPASIRTGGRPSKEEALLAVAVVSRIRRAIADASDSIVMRIGPASASFGESFGVEAWARELFAEEVVRGGPAFAVSLVISAIEPVLRNAAALAPWQVISPSPATGVVEVVDVLSDVQEKVYTTPTVLLAHQVTGEEEIPEGVVGVLTPDAPDVLSHVSVRARNMHVLFATCYDKGPLDQLKGLKGKTLSFSTTASGAVSWHEVSPDTLAQGAGAQAAANNRPAGLKISSPEWCGKWVVPMADYKDGVVGAKSKNLAKLQGKLPSHIRLPGSVTVPFGSFEKVLDLPENKDIKQRLSSLVQSLHRDKKGGGLVDGLLGAIGAGSNGNGNGNGAKAASNGNGTGAHHSAAEVLAQCRDLAMQVTVPAALREDLGKAMKAAGLPVPANEQRWQMALTALKGVWASKYNDRAFYSMRKVGLNFDDVRMAVLVQRVVPARYAFVIHTKNPSNNDETEVFCEMVMGLGESLVSGMVAGSAIAFKAPKSNLSNPEVLCYASKSEAMYVPESLIFRSDSNGEDLEGYAGAGLYESITMDPTENRRVDYMEDQLVQDPGFRKHILSEVCKVGYDIEKALGSAQDVEGVVDPEGNITIVQTRPQV